MIMNDFRFRVISAHDESIYWAGSGRREASSNFENAVSSVKAAGLHDYILLQELINGSYHTLRGRVIS